MSEEEQEKLYELLFKDTKNKLEEAIEKLRIANAELRDELDKKNSEIEEQQNKIASQEKQIKLMQSCDLAKVIDKQQKEIEALELIHETYKEVIEDIENRYISKDKIRERIKINEELIKEPAHWKYAENENKIFEIENMCLEELLEE